MLLSRKKVSSESIENSLFEKLKTYSYNQQEYRDSLRMITAIIQMQIKSSDQRISSGIIEKLIESNFFFMDILIKILLNCKDSTTSYNIINVIRECISLKIIKPKSLHNQEKNKASEKLRSNFMVTELVQLNIVEILLEVLTGMQHLKNYTFQKIVQDSTWILSKVAFTDKCFIIKVLSSNTIKLFHEFLKLYYNKNEVLLSNLLLMKYFIKNAVIAEFLIKDGIALTLAKTFIYLDYSPSLKLCILINCLKHLTTTKSYCIKLVEVGIVKLLMKIFVIWKTFEGQLCFKISSYSLITLQHLSKLSIGRKSIRLENGLRVLHHYSMTCPENEIYDHILLYIYRIIDQCLLKKNLAAPEISPIRFQFSEEISLKLKHLQNINNDTVKGRKMDTQCCYGNGHNLTKIKKNKCEAMENNLYTKVTHEPNNDINRYRKFFQEFDNLHLPSYKRKLHLLKKEDLSADSQFNIFKFNSNYLKNKRIYKNISEENLYPLIANCVRSVVPFSKIAYPDKINMHVLNNIHLLNVKKRQVCRNKLLACIDRAVYPTTTQKIVYNLDDLIAKLSTSKSINKILDNYDKENINIRRKDTQHLFFESRFECGNLRKAIQIGPREYDLILTPDVNSNSQQQWFYFEVSNMEAMYSYTFNIINCEKSNSQFNFGMKPIIFSVTEALNGHSEWIRTGTDICYYRNCYNTRDGKNYFTISFSLTFPHSNDICYLAYHFPYTYSYFITSIYKWLHNIDHASIYFRIDKLCDTLNGNENPLLTITAPDSYDNPIHKRKIIFLTSRVHPGESNTSWIMHGTLEALLGKSIYVQSLRNDYVFKIIPMLNIEGVINGCNRYGLTREDLNRCWNNPNQYLHPTVYHTKSLLEYCQQILVLSPFIFVDYHGHSRRKNIFFFGCSNSDSWNIDDNPLCNESFQYLVLPLLMQKHSSTFSLPLCSFKIEKYKESTARIVLWRQFGVIRSYTMECSFCGCDQGSLAGYHFNINHLLEIGNDFCKALESLKYSAKIANINQFNVKYCCPQQCIFKKSTKPMKCIQDRHAKQHFIKII